ncbi:mechanosensitive ion channel domain-containing protein [Arenibaculum sp.]|uniref:mechanosensitive ion channel domain-containing protein n=1 Tax=Arenibaculum sp. TaxID=2865862 RepID=UPI002E122E29|nr:mechanosensitive ion channel domain-containing protein [Arenibaculum sp.]
MIDFKSLRPLWSLRPLLPLLLLAFVVLAPAPGRSQTPEAPAPAAATIEADAAELRGLLAALEDPAEREKLTARLRALLAIQDQAEPVPGALGARTLEFLSERVAALSRQLVAAGAAFRDLPVALDWARRQVTDDWRHDEWIELGLQLAGVIVAGFLAAGAAERLLRGPRGALERQMPRRTLARVPLLLGRMVIEIVPIVAFALAGYGMLSITDPPRVSRLAALLVINAHILIGLVLVATRALLAPQAPGLRLPPMADETAHYLYIWVRRIAFTAVYGYLIGETASLLGLPEAAYLALLKLVGLVVTIMLVILIMQNRSHVATWLRGNPISGGQNGGVEATEIAEGRRSMTLRTARRRFADVWHVLAVLYVLFAYAILALGIHGGFEFMVRATVGTIVTVIVARLLVTVLDRVLRRGFAISPELKAQFPKLDERANRYVPMLERGLKTVVWLIALLAVLDAWGLDGFGWIETPFGARLLSSLFSIMLVLVIAVLAWEVVSNMIERYLTGRGADGGTVQRSARVRTLLPLLRNAFLVVLVAVVVLILLSEIGLDIAPLLAGAGVIGLAVGFGSQTLVKDVITGMFILFEDTISVGDVVDVGNGHSGVVEAISIRTIRLRDLTGTVHAVPFSQVASVKNLTKDFSFYVFDISIAYDEDSDRVVDIVRELGGELQQDPVFSGLILEPIEVLGVDRFADSAVIIKARFKTRPSQQWGVGREFNRRLKKRFDERGVEIPFPQRTVHVRSDVPLPPDRLAELAGPASG